MGGLSYYYRIGDTGPEHPIGAVGDLAFDYADVSPTAFTAHYIAAHQFKVAMKYSILGAGTNASLLSFNLRLDSLIDDPSTPFVNFHLFAYNDLGLNGTAIDGSMDIGPTPPPSIYNVGTQLDAGATLRDTISGSNGGGTFLGPNEHQAGTATAIFGLLQDGTPTDLDGTLAWSNDDLAYAFQYDFLLLNMDGASTDTAGKLFSILDTKILMVRAQNTAIPEPLTSTLAILGVGSLGLHLLRRRAV
jgi:hypothetical protein